MLLCFVNTMIKRLREPSDHGIRYVVTDFQYSYKQDE